MNNLLSENNIYVIVFRRVSSLTSILHGVKNKFIFN
jgi:hypothetical protein